MSAPAYYELTCYGCGDTFYWTATDPASMPPSYHSERCRKRHNHFITDNPGRCPRKDKEFFVDIESANARAKTLSKPGTFIRPYRCTCGKLHVGHINFRIVQNIPVDV